MALSCICLHGFGENRRVYAPFIQAMGFHMHTVGIDLMGHGSNRKADYTVSEVLQDIDAAVQAIETDVILVGTSFGGISSYIFASEAQKHFKSRDRVKGLIINDVPCCIPSSSFFRIAHHLENLMEDHYDDLALLDAKYSLNGFRLDREPLSEQNWQNFLEATVSNGEMNYDRKFIQTILDSEHGIETIAEHVQFTNLNDLESTPVLDLRYYYSSITKPILLFRGTRTTFFPSYVRGFMDANPLLTTVDIPGGHFLDLSRDRVMEVIISWINQHFYA
jgi:pimeloyl-ACP methyl ester carboxylesterase